MPASLSLPRPLLDLRAELARRTALARQPSPEGVRSPSLRRLLGEVAALAAGGPLPDYCAARPRPVMLLPGFGAHPVRMKPLAAALDKAGHRAHHWGLGFNLGPTPENFAFLLSRVEGLARRHGEPVALVGWSLSWRAGGAGRLVARRAVRARDRPPIAGSR